MCITQYAPDCFGVVALDTDPYPGLDIDNSEYIEAYHERRCHGEVRASVARIVRLYDPRYYRSWPGRNEIEKRVRNSVDLWPLWQQKMVKDDPLLLDRFLSSLLDECEAVRANAIIAYALVKCVAFYQPFIVYHASAL